MNTRVTAAIAIPQTSLHGPLSITHIRDFLGRAETLGYESAWVVDRILGAGDALEAVELLTYAAAVTTRMRLGAAVLLTALHSPVHMAKRLATLDGFPGAGIVGSASAATRRSIPPTACRPIGAPRASRKGSS